MKRGIMHSHAVNEERLGKLADLLLSENYKWFEYRIDTSIRPEPDSSEMWYSVPSLEIAISESIHVFPDLWCWKEQNEIAFFRDDPLQTPISSALIFYNLDILMYTHLFVPFRQIPFYFGGTHLGLTVRPAEIGNNIRALLDNYKSIMN